MDFSETLDFIMNITNTNNSMLAKHIELDPSFISRLRNGSRTPSKNENYLDSISYFISKRFEQDYQKESLKSKFSIAIDTLDMNENILQMIILNLLSQNSANKNYHVSNFIKDLDQFSFKRVFDDNLKAYEITENLDQNVFFGLKGKREAVLRFLLNTIESPKPQTLLLYSDEDMEWLLTDTNFAKTWSELFSKVISLGHKIKIIHTINRSINDVFNAIRLWMPFYMTGSIEPYYYPRNRDSVFRRTIFIAPESCALISNSVNTNIANSPNFIFCEKNTIDGLVSEYNDYLALCKPLMKTFSTNFSSAFIEALSKFESQAGDSLLKSPILSSLTMPLFILEKATKDLDEFHKNSLFENHKNRLKHLEKHLKTNTLTEFISLPAYEDIYNKNIKILSPSLLSDYSFYYDQFSFKSQLENIISLLNRYKNYHLVLLDTQTDDLTIYAKENVGVIITRYTSPTITFAINEPFITNAFWDYLSLINPLEDRHKNYKKETIKTLQKYIDGLLRV